MNESDDERARNFVLKRTEAAMKQRSRGSRRIYLLMTVNPESNMSNIEDKVDAVKLDVIVQTVTNAIGTVRVPISEDEHRVNF